jgi:hypothetical protein
MSTVVRKALKRHTQHGEAANDFPLIKREEEMKESA